MPARRMDSDGLRALVRAQARAWARGDAEAIAGAFAARCQFIVPRVRLASREQVRRAALEYFAQFRDTRVRIRRIVIDRESAAVEWRWSDVNRESGEVSQADDAIVARVRNGKIVYWREYIDSVSCLSEACAGPDVREGLAG